MKKILLLILALIIGVSLYLSNSALADEKFAHFWWRSACDQLISLTVGAIDSRFNLSPSQFQTDIKQAMGIWESAYGQKLFSFDPTAKLKVNLVYDERQSLSNQINQLQNNLNQNKTTLNPEIIEFEKRVQQFKDQVQKLNEQIAYWNNHGGAPPEVYKQLSEQRDQLQQEANSLNTQAKQLKIATENYNAQVSQLNSTVSDFNQAIEQKPEEGLYDPTGSKIDIYFNLNQKELVHTLAHELGHSLGIDHNNNPKSIMYPKTNQEITLSAEDLAALKQVCQKHNVLELAGQRLAQVINYYQTQLNKN